MVEMLSIYDTDGTLLRRVPVCPESDSGEACIGRENCIMGGRVPHDGRGVKDNGTSQPWKAD